MHPQPSQDSYSKQLNELRDRWNASWLKPLNAEQNYKKPLPRKFLCNDPTAESCRALWVAVLEVSIDDALQEKFWSIQHRDSPIEVLRWIQDGGRHFRFVCDLAGVSPEWVQRKVNERITEGPREGAYKMFRRKI